LITATDLMQYKSGAAIEYQNVPGGGIPVTPGSSSQSFQVRVKATDSAFASAPRSVAVPARRAAPNAVYNGSTDRITGTTKSMEYRLDSGTWTDILEPNLPRSLFGSAETIQIRYKANLSSPASREKTIKIPDQSAPFEPGLRPSPKLDINKEIVENVSNQMEYSTNGTRWTAIPGRTLNITTLIPAPSAASESVTLYIRNKGTNTTAASQPVTITLPRRPAAPEATVAVLDGFSEQITVAASETALLEYRARTAGSFEKLPDSGILDANVGSSVRTFQLRYKATDKDFASAVRSVNVRARAAAPGALYHRPTDRIANVSPFAEYSFSVGGPWTSVTDAFIPRAVLQSEYGDGAGVIFVRIRATATTPASAIKKVSFPAYVAPAEPEPSDPSP